MLDSRRLRSLCLGVALACAACGDEESGDEKKTSPTWYVTSAMIVGPEGPNSYVATLPSLDAQQIDLANTREFAGVADAWVLDGKVFVGDSQKRLVTKFDVAPDGSLVQIGEPLSFLNYGLSGLGFQNNTFISSTKAYMQNGIEGYVIWNPQTMTITGTVDFPDLAPHTGLMAMPAYMDRTKAQRPGRFYQAVYWTDSTYSIYAPDSAILVVDTDADKVLKVLSAPCPGLDSSGTDDAGNIYLGPWMWAGPSHVILDGPASCVVKIPPGSDELGGAPITFASIAGGREGAAVHYYGGSKLIFSALYPEHANVTPTTKVSELSGGANWRLWSYDLNTAQATIIDAIDWSSGAYYLFPVDGRPMVSIAAADYSRTVWYDLTDVTKPVARLTMPGWGVRLFKVR